MKLQALRLTFSIESPAPAAKHRYLYVFRNTCFVENMLTATSDFRITFSVKA